MAAERHEVESLQKASAELAVKLRAAYANVKTVDRGARYYTYALLLQDGPSGMPSVYVGSSDNIYMRMYEHATMSPSSAAWIRERGPVKRILEIFANCGRGDEAVLTLKWMGALGYECVRGASFCKADLDGPPRNLDDFSDVPKGIPLPRRDVDAIWTFATLLAVEFNFNTGSGAV